MNRQAPMTFLRLIAVAFLAAPASAAAPHVTLTISPANTLPGLSVPLALRIRTGSYPVYLAGGVRVRVTPPAGEPFIADWGGGLDLGLLDIYPADGDPIVIGTRTSYDLVIPAVDLSRPSWALDPRLVPAPDAYRIEVLLYDVRAPRTDKPATPLVVSTPAMLRIAAPDEADDYVWQSIQRREHRTIADQVALEHSSSPYFPYLALLSGGESRLEAAAAMSRAIELHPSSPVIPWLHAAIARVYAAAGLEVFVLKDDIPAAVEYSDLARAELLKLQAIPNAWAREKAKQQLEVLPGRAEYHALRLERRIHSRVPK